MGKPFISQVSKSTPFDNSTNGFTSQDAQSAIEESKTSAIQYGRSPLLLVNNNNLQDGQFVSYSELSADNVILFPLNYVWQELSWSNHNGNISFDLEFFKNGSAPSNRFYTYSIRNQVSRYGYLNGLNFTFNAGDYMLIKYKKIGSTVLSGLAMTLWITRS